MHRLTGTLPGKRSLRLASIILQTLVSLASAQTDLAPALRSNIDDIVHNVLATTGVPSASLAVVKDGRVAYLQAYGDARLDPHMPARRCGIASAPLANNSRLRQS
jgi:D-alanyl-D-alanine carboxypeptidase